MRFTPITETFSRHQLQRMKSRRLQQRHQSANQLPLAVRSSGNGKPVDNQAAGGSQALEAFRKGISADGIHDHFDAVRREFAHDLHEIGFGVVNRVADADFAQILLLGRAGGAEHFDAARPRKLHGGNSHSAGGAMNEHSVAGKQIAHREHRVIAP